MPAHITAARDWIGTPYQHQAALKGVGCDCLGLLLGIWRDAGGIVPAVPAYSRDWSEASGQETLWSELGAHLRATDQPGLGDVTLFRMRGGAVAKHLGLISDIGADARFIHAMSGHGVIESRLTEPWKRRIVASFAWPDLERGD